MNYSTRSSTTTAPHFCLPLAPPHPTQSNPNATPANTINPSQLSRTCCCYHCRYYCHHGATTAEERPLSLRWQVALVCQKTSGLLGVGQSAMNKIGKAIGLGGADGQKGAARVALRPAAGGGM